MDFIKRFLANEDHMTMVARFVKTFLYSFLGTYVAMATTGSEVHWGIVIASSVLAALGYTTDKAIRTYPTK